MIKFDLFLLMNSLPTKGCPLFTTGSLNNLNRLSLSINDILIITILIINIVKTKIEVDNVDYIMKKVFLGLLFVLTGVLLLLPVLDTTNVYGVDELPNEPIVKLGNEVLFSEDYYHLVRNKDVGLITNQTGINSKGESTVDVLAEDDDVNLKALYTPEHGLDGVARAGEYVESYTHEELDIPVYSLYGATREPTEEMLEEVEVLLFDIQDIGARTYTYISTLNYSMVAGEKYDTPVIILDRPNILGGITVEGPVLEEEFISFVGVDKLPKAHGMTVGEITKFFNREINADIEVVPMSGYQRNMIFQDTGLPWQQTSPNIPEFDSSFKYMATGLGEGTGVYQSDYFNWIGGNGLDAEEFAQALNDSDLKGVEFEPEYKGEAGGVNLNIYDYHRFNPARTGIHALTNAFKLGDFQVPKSDLENNYVVMFDKIMGTDKIGKWLDEGLAPEEIESNYSGTLEEFKEKREQYLLDKYEVEVMVRVDDAPISFDSEPYIDDNDRLMVPLRAISEALGAQVGWDESSRRVTIIKENDEINFTIDDSTAYLNGEAKEMDTNPVIRNDRTMLPARYVSEYLGADVDWLEDWEIVNIDLNLR